MPVSAAFAVDVLVQGLGLAAAFVGPASAAKDAATASLRRPSSWQLGAEGRSSSGPGLALSVLIAGAGPSGSTPLKEAQAYESKA